MNTSFTQNRREFLTTTVATGASAACATSGLVAGLVPGAAMAAGIDEAAGLVAGAPTETMVDLFLWGDAFGAPGTTSGAGAQLHLPLDVQSTVWIGQPGSFAERALYEVKATHLSTGQLRVQLQPQLLEAHSCGAQVCTGADVAVEPGVVTHVPVTLVNGKRSTLLVAFDQLH